MAKRNRHRKKPETIEHLLYGLLGVVALQVVENIFKPTVQQAIDRIKQKKGDYIEFEEH